MANLEVAITLAGHDAGASGAIGAVENALGRITGAALAGFGLSIGYEAFQKLREGIEGVGSAAGNFQQAMVQVQNNTTMTSADVGQMHDAVLKLGSETGASFDTLGQGFMHITNLTGDAAHAVDILSVANESAVSTGGNVAQTANVLANAMHEYGMDVSHAATETERHTEIQTNAAHVMGVMHLAAAEANMTLEQFSQSGGQVFAWAANLHVPMEEASAAFATMTKHGFDAAESGTQVKDMMEHMIKVSPEATKELKNLSNQTGIDLVRDFSAAGLETKGLSGVVEDLHQTFTKLGLSESEQTAEVMKLLPNIRGGAALFTLLGTGAEDFHNILNDLNDGEKVNNVTAQSMANTQQTVAFQMGVLGRTAEAAAITFGEVFLPNILPVITALAANLPGALAVAGSTMTTFSTNVKAGAAEALQAVADKLASTGAAWAPWAAQAGPAGDLVSGALVGVSGAVQAIQLLLQGNFTGAWQTAAGAMGSFASAANALDATLQANLPIIVAVGAALGTFVVLTTVVPAVMTAVAAFGALTAVAGALGAVFAGGGLMAGLGVIVAILGGPVTLAIVGVAAAVGLLAAAWTTNFGDIQGKTAAAADAIGTALGLIGSGLDLFDATLRALPQTLATFAAAAGAAFSELGTNVQAALDALGTAIGSAFDQIGTTVRGALDAVGSSVGGFFGDLGSTVQGGLDAVHGFFTDTWSAIPEDIRSDLGIVIGLIGEHFSALGSAVQAGMAAVVAAISSSWSTAIAAVGAAMSAIGSVVSAGWDAVSSAVGSAMSAVGSAIGAGWDAISSAVGAAMSAVGSVVSAGWATVQGATEAAWAAISSAIGSALATALGAVQGWIGQVIGAIQGMAGQLAAAGASAGQAAVDGLVGAINAGIAAVGAAAAALARSALASAKAALGAQSPSTEFATLGQNITEGLTAGIAGGTADVVGATHALGRDADAAFADEIEAHSRSRKFHAHGENVAQSVADGINSKNPDVKAAARELARQAAIAVQEARPVGEFIVAGEDMGDGISLGLLRGVDKAKSAADTYGNSIIGEMHTFTRNVETEIESTTNKLTDIQAKADETISSALDHETDAIGKASTNLQEALDKLSRQSTITTDVSARRQALQTQISDEERAHAQKSQDDETDYQHTLKLAEAETKFKQTQAKELAKYHADLEDAKTAKERAAVEDRHHDALITQKAQHADEITNINQTLVDQQAATAHRRELETADRAFKATEDAKAHALDKTLADEAMQRQIDDLTATKNTAVQTAQDTYLDAVTKANLTADTQRAILLRSYDQRIGDLKTAFLDKIPPLEGPALDAFNAFMDGITGKTDAMAATVAGGLGTASDDAAQTAEDISAAFGITDAAIETFADTNQLSWDDARLQMNEAARTAQQALGTGGTMPTAIAATDTAVKDVSKTHKDILKPALDGASKSADDLVRKGLAPLAEAATTTGKDIATQISFVLQQLDDKMPSLIQHMKDFGAALLALPRVNVDVTAAASGGSAPASSAFDTGASGGPSPFPGHIGESGPGGIYNNPATGRPYAFASGGIVTSPTFALIGEAGPELVIPLEGHDPAGVLATLGLSADNFPAIGSAPGQGTPHLAGGGIVTHPTFAMVGEIGPEIVVPLTGSGTPQLQATSLLNSLVVAGLLSADSAESIAGGIFPLPPTLADFAAAAGDGSGGTDVTKSFNRDGSAAHPAASNTRFPQWRMDRPDGNFGSGAINYGDSLGVWNDTAMQSMGHGPRQGEDLFAGARGFGITSATGTHAGDTLSVYSKWLQAHGAGFWDLMDVSPQAGGTGSHGGSTIATLGFPSRGIGPWTDMLKLGADLIAGHEYTLFPYLTTEGGGAGQTWFKPEMLGAVMAAGAEAGITGKVTPRSAINVTGFDADELHQMLLEIGTTGMQLPALGQIGDKVITYSGGNIADLPPAAQAIVDAHRALRAMKNSTGGIAHFAEGGILTEPVMGIGRSGQRYAFAETGPEAFGGVGNVGGLSEVQLDRLADKIVAGFSRARLSVHVDEVHTALLQKGRRGALGLS